MYKKTSGSVLILVLMIVAIISALGVNAVDRIHSDIFNSLDASSKNQSFWYALGVESTASNLLEKKDNQSPMLNTFYPNQELPLIKVDLQNISIEGQLSDLRACFNLNSLIRIDSDKNIIANQPGIDHYRNLLDLLSFDDFSQDQLIFSLLDWLDSNDYPDHTEGGELDFYSRLESPLRPSNQLLFSFYELLNVKSYNLDILRVIEDYSCVLPESGSGVLNINSVSEKQSELLSAYTNQSLSIADARIVILDRPPQGFATLEEFYSHPKILRLNLSSFIKQRFVLNSDFYLLSTKVDQSNKTYNIESLMQITKEDGVRVLSRKERVF